MIKVAVLAQVVKDLAIEQPDTRAVCKYFNEDGTPCCIVGAGLARLGVDTEPFLSDDDHELNKGTSVTDLRIHDIVENVPYGDASLKFLALIQTGQDMGKTWGEAYAYASEKYPLA